MHEACLHRTGGESTSGMTIGFLECEDLCQAILSQSHLEFTAGRKLPKHAPAASWPPDALQAREFMYNTEKALAKAKERAARAHDSDLDALVAKSDAEASVLVHEQAKASANKALEELRSVSSCHCCTKSSC